MKITLMSAIIASFLTISASAGESVQQTTATEGKLTTTQEYLAQPNIEPNYANMEPAAGGAAEDSKNPLLERKFNNFKK